MATLARIVLSLFAAIVAASLAAWAAEPLGIDLEGFPYPFPVSFLPLTVAHQPVRMGYMDIAPTGPANGHAVLLLHGRNFPASYWEPVIRALTAAGFRVVVPDQIGFNKSSKPEGPWSFDDAAVNTAALLEALHLPLVDVVGHSMGGMLAMRFVRSYPDRVRRLVLESPLGLENYRLYVPPVPHERLFREEISRSAEDYLHYLFTAYGLTLPREAVMPFVDIRERMKGSAEYPRWVEAYVSTYYAIWGQPVIDEMPSVATPTMLMVGARDHTAPGRNFAPPELRDRMGHIAELARALAAKMPHGNVEEFDTGHLIHLEATVAFDAALLRFLNAP
ncbi:MAG: alpha/beta hydrolase [Alphaproteobacteria bacterium]|nr:alpha/beta hydrolase [Alphaproteobacteria bacterium]